MPKKIRDWIESILFAGAVVAILFVVFWPFSVSGSSMEPCLSDRERIAISRVTLWLGRYGRGDIVVCKQERVGKVENVVKRIIGVPGDLLEIRDGDVYINGELLPEDYLLHNHTAGELEVELAAGEYFVMGDNRSVSADSRNAGPVKSDEIVGRVVMRWFPFNKIAVY